MLKRSRGRGLVVLVLILAFAGIGYVILHNSHAATTADVNNDGIVNILDLSVVASNYGGSGKTFAQGDITGDGTVNVFDFSVLASQWGQSSGGGNGVNKARPFAASSPWNTPLSGGPLDPTAAAPTWSDAAPIHDRMQIIGPNNLGGRDSAQIQWANASSPVTWRFLLSAFNNPNDNTFNRYGTLSFKSELGPTTLAEASNPDHVLTLAREDTGRYIELWLGFVDAAKRLVTGQIDTPTQGVLRAGQDTATATSLTGGGITSSMVGQWIVATQGKFAKITSVSGTTATFSGGWIDSNGTAATTPAILDFWGVSNNIGIATGISGTAGATGTLTDSSKSWASNNLASVSNKQRLLVCGNAFMIVTSNTGTVITGTGGWRDIATGANVNAPSTGLYYVTGSNNDPPTYAEGNMITGTGTGGLVAQGGNTAGGRAANFSWAAGLITGADTSAGKIDHALAMMGGSDIWSSMGWTAPATSPLGALGGGPLGMGTRIAIPNTPANVAVRSTLTTTAGQMLFDALINYGAFGSDYAGGGFNYFVLDGGTQSINWDSFWALPFEHGGGDDWAKIAPLLRYTTNYP